MSRIPVSILRPPRLSLALMLFALSAGTTCTAAMVQAPPRPIGSTQVVIIPGEPATGKYNEMHGHHHQGHIKKDKTKSDDKNDEKNNNDDNGNIKKN